MHCRTWTTAYGTAARRWADLDPHRADDIARLLAWAEGRRVASAAELAAVLGRNGAAAAVVDRFAGEVGLWFDPVTPDAG